MGNANEIHSFLRNYHKESIMNYCLSVSNSIINANYSKLL